jgi:hypothetical protein
VEGGGQAALSVAPVQLTGEHDLRKLAVAIRLGRTVLFLVLQIVEVGESYGIKPSWRAFETAWVRFFTSSLA